MNFHMAHSEHKFFFIRSLCWKYYISLEYISFCLWWFKGQHASSSLCFIWTHMLVIMHMRVCVCLCPCVWVKDQRLMSNVFLNPFILFSETRSITEPRAAVFTRLDEHQSLEILLSLLSENWGYRCMVTGAMVYIWC